MPRTEQIALRWRTEDEVLSGAGETSCGNTRCPYHDVPGGPSCRGSHDIRSNPPRQPKLTTMELPFSYVEHGETDPREAMVKVVLCERCVKKLMWKREKEKRDQGHTSLGDSSRGDEDKSGRGVTRLAEDAADPLEKQGHKGQRIRHEDRSRSRSPRRSLGHKQPGYGGR